MSNILGCLKSRAKWYNKAIDIKCGVIEWENGFDFPDGDITAWQGATKELNNTINMIEAVI